MSEERRLAVLRAIVQDYVRTSGTGRLQGAVRAARSGGLAATVRNDMALLEEGLIHAPYTSAGRVPTDAGYRVFVDRLSQVKPLSRAGALGHRGLPQRAVDLDDIVDRTVHLLATLTSQVAVMQYPRWPGRACGTSSSSASAAPRLMLVLIVSTGRVEQRVLDVGRDLSGLDGDGLVSRLRAHVNAEACGRPFREAAVRLDHLLAAFPAEDHPVVEAVAGEAARAPVEQREERVVLAGTSNLARVHGDFTLSLGPVLRGPGQHVVLLRLIGHLGSDQDAIAVRIGSEHEYEGLRSTSVVTAGYGPGAELLGESGSSGRPGWTTPRRWPPSGRWPGTSRRSSPHEPPHRRVAVRHTAHV